MPDSAYLASLVPVLVLRPCYGKARLDDALRGLMLITTILYHTLEMLSDTERFHLWKDKSSGKSDTQI